MKRYLIIGCMVVALAISIGAGHWQTVQADAGKTAAHEALTWNRFDKALALAKQTKKYIVVDFYTDWCHWCKVMDEKTYGDKGIQAQLNKSFILVKLDAESPKPLIIDGRSVSEAQIAAMFKVNTYPTTWFMTADGKPIAPVKGYVPPERFAPILRYIEGGYYTKMEFDMYMEREKPKKNK